MSQITAYERFPSPIVFLSNLLSISLYAIGVYILGRCGIFWMVLYLLYCGWIEIRLLRHSCASCYYYGKVCAFGKGKLCALLFKKGDPQKFAEVQVRWRDLVPDFLVSIFPLIGGIVLLVMDFNWIILTLLIVLLVLSSAGNAFVRGSFACKYCKQKELGCPAEKLFNKKPVED
ncbi:MAG: hypothetical protein A2Z25_09550 [Planctomycetes bacterium RBG_16_55_9]|nr:MAG: hypothetical protein A2Z25_09550 [Planctomycetes bacterium RBG_16_55_9]